LRSGFMEPSSHIPEPLRVIVYDKTIYCHIELTTAHLTVPITAITPGAFKTPCDREFIGRFRYVLR
ncbi:hypothetical protein, partial [Enterocloster citroniae]|uniref:hypothetical protein n=1 Tax=Enterocloster citroniae TaxID=358743 RepID=UPI001D15DCF3